MNKLNKYGKGYIVGGAIRDILLGLRPKDVDFTTNLPYGTLKTLFSEYTPKETGKSFGVLRIRINNIPLKDLKIKKNLIIAYIVRNNVAIFPKGTDVIKEGDRVIIITTESKRRKRKSNKRRWKSKRRSSNGYNKGKA